MSSESSNKGKQSSGKPGQGEPNKHHPDKPSHNQAEAKPSSGSHGENAGKTDKVEGEGSYTATHNYDEGVRKSVEKGTDKGAEAAKKAVDGPEGKALKEAEDAAKHGKSVKPSHK